MDDAMQTEYRGWDTESHPSRIRVATSWVSTARPHRRGQLLTECGHGAVSVWRAKAQRRGLQGASKGIERVPEGFHRHDLQRVAGVTGAVAGSVAKPREHSRCFARPLCRGNGAIGATTSAHLAGHLS